MGERCWPIAMEVNRIIIETVTTCRHYPTRRHDAYMKLVEEDIGKTICHGWKS